MDALLEGKFANSDIEFADEQINNVLRNARNLRKENRLDMSMKSAKFITDLHSDYKHKSAANRLSEKVGDLMWQKQLQYEARIHERLKGLFKNQIKGE